MIFLQNIKYGKFELVERALSEWNLGIVGGASSSTIVLMDATGSMSALIELSKSTVAVMFERIQNILR